MGLFQPSHPYYQALRTPYQVREDKLRHLPVKVILIIVPVILPSQVLRANAQGRYGITSTPPR